MLRLDGMSSHVHSHISSLTVNKDQSMEEKVCACISVIHYLYIDGLRKKPQPLVNTSKNHLLTVLEGCQDWESLKCPLDFCGMQV